MAGGHRWRSILRSARATGIGALAALTTVAIVGGPGVQPTRNRDSPNLQGYVAYAEGLSLYGARRYEDAAPVLERAVVREPDYGSAWALLAKTYRPSG